MELGNQAKALQVLEEAIQMSREIGMPFVGPRLLGTLSLCSESLEVQTSALQEGFSILKSGCHAHNQLWFLRDAIENSLRTKRDSDALMYADYLEHITNREPLAWANYFIKRARLMVHSKLEPKDPTTEKEFVRLEQIAKHAGFSIPTIH